MEYNKILIILGPTATGKTDLALSLAKKFNGELISCDSRQVYKGLDIGTGKLPSNPTRGVRRTGPRGSIWELNGIKIWMYDVVDLKSQYTVFNYVRDANGVIDEILERGKLPIVVGGTGLYLKALLEGLSNLAIPVDPKLRKELEKLSLEQLQNKLQKLSPKRWEKMNSSDRQNPRRLIRAIEILSIKTPPRCDEVTPRRWREKLKIGLTAPREILYRRIDERVVSRIDQGMIDEVKRLHKKGLTFKRMRELGLEYGVLVSYLEGKIVDREELVKLMQGKVHGFTRRQLTWFKNPSTSSGNIQWFDITDIDFPNNVEKAITKWYDTLATYVAKN